MKKIVAFVLGLIFAFATVTIAADKVVVPAPPAPAKTVIADNTVKKTEVKKKTKKVKKSKKPVAKKPVAADNTVKVK